MPDTIEEGTLPLQPDQLKWKETERGAFVYVIPLGESEMAKVSIASILPSRKEVVISKLQSLAKDKKSVSDLLERYIGGYFPKLVGVAVVDSPRRELERRMEKKGFPLWRNRLEDIPASQPGVMEIVKRVGGQNLDKYSFSQLEGVLSDEKYRKQTADLADKLLQLLREKGTMVDICDDLGPRFKTQSGGIEHFSDMKEAWRGMLEGVKDGLIYPANIMFDERSHKIWFVDAYPVYSTDMRSDEVDNMWNLVNCVDKDGGNIEPIEAFWQLDEQVDKDENGEMREGEDMKARRQAFYYLLLLKKMGAKYK